MPNISAVQKFRSADIHLAPMIGYFAMAEEGEALLKTHRKLGQWWSTMSARPRFARRCRDCQKL